MIFDPNNKRRWPLMVLRMVLFMSAAALIGAFAVMLLWNTILPSLIHVGLITYWQSLGLLVLTRLLFGRGGGCDDRRSWQRHRWHSKWTNMTEEERDAFKDEWKKRGTE